MAFPSGISDEQVQVLGSVSRVASLNDIAKWNVTKVDTLAALMKADDGSWETAKSKAIITKYLNTPGNSLGSTELNSIDSNLCSLDTSTLKTITTQSMSNAKPLNVASCSSEQKKVLYEISNTSFSSQNPGYYNLITPYLGGAPVTDVRALSNLNISMSVDVLQSLDSNVIKDLTVNDVKSLMGTHLNDLKTFENATAVKAWTNNQTQADLDTPNAGVSMHPPATIAYHLKSRKTNQHGPPQRVYLFRLESLLSRNEPIRDYLNSRSTSRTQEPLFITEAGKGATRSWCLHRFRQVLARSGIPPESYSGH
ncbi:Mesothelin [Liparis tanakae]|uniref:Mesothelin n=1 Tax=Liparis tanakae TaxID=230148 RepID=A0A4Z2HW38_9TELE|nr:Mesothelin [Liparis tanakae]